MHLATPCTSWSTARRGPLGSHWGPLRSAAYPMGIPGLSERDRQKIDLGNRAMFFSCEMIRLCLANGVSISLENPHSSRIFKAAKLAALLEHPRAETYVVDLCQFGTEYRKRTRIVGWNCGFARGLSAKRCSTNTRICSRTSQPHSILGPNHTRAAQEYPWPLAHALGSWLVTSARSAFLSRSLPLFCGGL